MSVTSRKNKKRKLLEIRKTQPNYGKIQCKYCGRWAEPSDMITGSDPYDSEIGNDRTIVTQCRPCYNDSCWNI